MSNLVIDIIFIILGVCVVLFAVRLSSWQVDRNWANQQGSSEQMSRGIFKSQNREGMLRRYIWLHRILGICVALGGVVFLIIDFVA